MRYSSNTYNTFSYHTAPVLKSSYLGNVLTVVSDRKLAHTTTPTSGIIDYYTSDILSANDYFCFGSLMSGRKFNSSVYRYGHENQEKDDEIYGEGNAYSFEYRMHDPRLGKFLSVDPLADNFPWNSPYAFSENRVISAIELEGLEAVDINGSGSVNHAEGEQGPQPAPNGSINGPYQDPVQSVFNGDANVTYGDVIVGSEQPTPIVNASGSEINNNFNCHGTPTNQDISEQYYKDLLSHTDIEHGQMLPATWMKGTRVTINGRIVNETGYPATQQEIAIHNYAEADVALIEMLEFPGGGFRSFTAFKRANGSAGKGKAWHHIVEQHKSNIMKFGPQKIHNLDNLISVESGAASVHSRISAFYSSKQRFSDGKTVRDWLKTQSFEEQYQFGLDILEMFK